MSPRSARRISRRWWIVAVAAAVAAAFAAWWFLVPRQIDDRTAASRKAVSAIEKWAKRRSLRWNEAASVREVRTEGGVRWLSFDLGYWYSPWRSPAVLVRELEALVKGEGFRTRRAPVVRGVHTVLFSFADGKPAGQVRIRREFLIAIVIDDMGANVAREKAVLALPVPVTCAIIPIHAHARAVDRLAAAAGKEVFVHMPMESPYRASYTERYRLMLRLGMTRADVAERVTEAISKVPHAVGMNNHEGSLATEDEALMRELMAELKPRRFVFLDSGTTDKTVAWKEARDAGLRYARRSVFLDNDLIRNARLPGGSQNAAAVEATFAKLVATARRRGRAIGIGHAQFPTAIEVIAARIPEVEAQGAEFVPASFLARSGK